MIEGEEEAPEIGTTTTTIVEVDGLMGQEVAIMMISEDAMAGTRMGKEVASGVMVAGTTTTLVGVVDSTKMIYREDGGMIATMKNLELVEVIDSMIEVDAVLITARKSLELEELDEMTA